MHPLNINRVGPLNFIRTSIGSDRGIVTNSRKNKSNGPTKPPSLWRSAKFTTVAALLPLPFDVRIDMTELGMRMAGSQDGKQYRLSTESALAEPPSESGSSMVYTIEQRLTWRTVFHPREGKLWVARVEARRQDFAEDATISDNDLAIAFMAFTLKVLNRYLRAYSIAAEDPAIRTLTPEAFDVAVAMIEFSGDRESDPIERRPFTLPEATRRGPETPMEQEILLKRLHHGLNSTNNQHPMDDVILWRLRAEHHADFVGDYELALIALQTSMERRVFVIRALLMIDDGANSAAVTAANDDGFKSAFNNLGHRLQGGTWDATDTTKPVGRYWRDLYMLRNKIAHGGRSVTRDDAQQAFDAHRELQEDIERRLLEKKTIFPRTAVAVIGAEGLRQKGHMSNRMKGFIESWEKAGEADAWTWLLPHDVR